MVSGSMRRRLAGRARGVAAVVMLGTLAACTTAAPPEPLPTDPGPTTTLSFLHARIGSDAAIVDESGREVQLRGVNLNHLGDYHQAYAGLPTVSPLTDEDWSDLAAQGASVVRLVTNWSAWEPVRGTLDAAYLQRVRDAVVAANAHGMWVVIDMHQDAWSSAVFTPIDAVCPAGTTHQKGWDGAPAWATFTNGRQTCTPNGREDSPAVIAAWNAFYANRDGIRSALATTWGRIAAEFADDPGVAGFDLLNEPGHGSDLQSTLVGLRLFLNSALDAIRASEDAVSARHHLVMFETTVFGAPVPRFSDDPNLVFAPHIYVEAIGPKIPGLLDLVGAGLMPTLGRYYERPVWVGEYGSFADAATNRSWMSRFARIHDRNGYDGGTWWQWEQECGDPHDVRYPADPAWVADAAVGCDGSRMAVECPARSYPRAVPGHRGSLSADPCGGRMRVTGSTRAPSTAELWFQPAPGDESGEAPTVNGRGISDVEMQRVGDGWRVYVGVAGDYEIELG